MRLTRDQHEAASARSSVAVTAGAGTGKTHLLTERYLFHVLEERLSPLEVVAITYTRRAAGELRARIRKQALGRMAGEETERLAEIEAAPIGTIHSLCARICREHPLESGAPPFFEILDETNSRLVNPDWIDEALDRLPIEIYQVIPFSILRRVMRSLLSDPVMAARAFAASGEPNGATSDQLEHWAALGWGWQVQTVEALVGSRDWSEWRATLQRVAGDRNDLIEGLRVRTLELVAGIESNRVEPGRWLAQLAELTTRGGSGRNWPEGGLDEAKAAIKQIRDAARRVLSEWEQFKLTAADHELLRVLPWLHRSFEQVRAETARMRRTAGLVDFADLEAMAWQALQYESVRDHYHQRWRAFLVDEFQDTSRIQAEIVEMLTTRARLTIVGDESQSIYGFRRAEVAIFRRLREEIVTRGGLSRTLSLSFRSHGHLIDRFNRIFTRIQPEAHSALEAHREEAPHSSPPLRFVVVEAGKGIAKEQRQRTEARAIASIIRQMIDQGMTVHDRLNGALRPVRPGDIAVLTRTRRPLEVFGEALGAAGIATAIIGGGDLLQTRVAMDLVALIRLLANPEENLALISILRSPFFAISDRTLQMAAEGRERREPWWRLLATSNIPELRRAFTILGVLLEQRRSLSSEALIRLADRLTGYTAVIAGLPNSARRLADWNAMVEWVGVTDRLAGNDIFLLWRHLRRLIDRQIAIHRPPIEARDAISLLTIHAAKGLEWPIVVVADLSGGRNSDDRPVLFDPALGVALRLPASQHHENGGSRPVLYSVLAASQDQRETEEERRLLYVALTRARDAVILSAADHKGGLLNHLTAGLEAAEIVAERVDYHPADRFAF
jgi:ATP-dependent helicase/nuclease subunit A